MYNFKPEQSSEPIYEDPFSIILSQEDYFNKEVPVQEPIPAIISEGLRK